MRRGTRASVFAFVWLGVVAGTVLAAEPTPTGAAGGDPRSSGEGPGLVGEPFLALAAVLAIAIVAVIVTTAWLRLTGGDTTRR